MTPNDSEHSAARWIEYQPLEDLAGADRNPKAHALADISNSIRLHGFTVPVLRDERTEQLVAGHGRLEALRRIRNENHPAPEGIEVRGSEWLVPVIRGWGSLDDRHAEALLVADNKLTETGGWENRGLAELLEDISDYSSDLLSSTGFRPDDLDKLISDVNRGDATDPAGSRLDGEDADDDDEDDPTAPGEFPSYDDETIATDFQCPKCSYAWSGKAK